MQVRSKNNTYAMNNIFSFPTITKWCLKTIDGTPVKCGFKSKLGENNVHVTSSTWLLLGKKKVLL